MRKPAFTSRMSRGQTLVALLWLPVHCFLLPVFYTVLFISGLWVVDEVTANLLIYAISTLVIVLVLWRFFRRDFDALCDRPVYLLFTVVAAYFFSRFGEALVDFLLSALSLTGTSDNNEAVIAMAKTSLGPTVAMSVFLAPIVEESIFRGAIFGTIRRRSRFWAYAVSIAAFCLYHVWQSVLTDPQQFLYMLLYVPASFFLAYVYERTNSIWSSIFLHMLTNGVAMLTGLAAGTTGVVLLCVGNGNMRKLAKACDAAGLAPVTDVQLTFGPTPSGVGLALRF